MVAATREEVEEFAEDEEVEEFAEPAEFPEFAGGRRAGFCLPAGSASMIFDISTGPGVGLVGWLGIRPL